MQLSSSTTTDLKYPNFLQVNGANISKLVKKAGIKVDAFWPKVFAKALKGRNVSDLLVGGGDGTSA